jgi:hypothetical protein
MSWAAVRDFLFGRGEQLELPRHLYQSRMLGAHVVVDIDASADVNLRGRAITGRILSCNRNIRGDAADALIRFDEPVAYHGHYTDTHILWIVVSPCVRCDQIEGLFVASAAVRVCDSLSIGNVRHERTIGVGRARFSDGTLWY